MRPAKIWNCPWDLKIEMGGQQLSDVIVDGRNPANQYGESPMYIQGFIDTCQVDVLAGFAEVYQQYGWYPRLGVPFRS